LLWFAAVATALVAVAAIFLMQRSGSAGDAPSPRTTAAPVPTVPKPVPEIVNATRPGRRVLFVGLDGADWQLLDAYMAEGKMPNLASLLREGQAGVLETQYPPLSPLLWTTMMTGASPLDHGILDFTRIHPTTRIQEPITSDERRMPAVWNMAALAGKHVAVFGMWATYPAEAVPGVLVSDRFFSFQHDERNPPPGIVYPPERETWARQNLERVEREIGYAEIKAYLPWLDEAEFRQVLAQPNPYSRPATALRRILVESKIYHDLVTSYLAEKPVDLAVVYVEGTDAIGHIFAPYNPPRQPQVPVEEFQRYSQVPKLYFEYVDRLLGDYRKLATDTGSVLMLASDHGFLWTEGRPKDVSSVTPATAGLWHRDDGIFLLWGKGIPHGTGHTQRGSIAQVCATLLALLGLPPGQGLTGPPLPGAPPVDAAPVDYAAHFERPTAPRVAVSPEDVEEDLEKLRSLGYIGGGDEGASSRGDSSTRTHTSYNNEGLILRTQGRNQEALGAYERALSVDPHNATALWNLSDLLFVLKTDLDRSDKLLVQSLAEGSHAGVRRIVARAVEYQKSGQADRKVKLLDAAIAVRPADAELRGARGN
jgi:tetratricopeptide (TPR) repeat protein